ncbi:MAG: hypothetical protein K2M00_04605 [Muribaculaceae bacterium]|nr:hypothetical protein [Muribaculaceae bacterium]
MQNLLIYGGIAINILGAVLLMIFAVKYYLTYRQVKNMPMRVDELRSRWYRQRTLGFGLLIGGTLIAIAGCYV